MSITARLLVALSALTLLITLFQPFWSIYLIAPQYPEGLSMQIWLNKLSGQVEIINGLNHYIGMKHIKEDMFPEFGYLPYVMVGYVVAGLAVAIYGRRRALFAYLILLLAGGALALYDFYQWGYDYGHNLDPNAAIVVPGLSYQPPLIGHKQLLNFDAYSYPATGGWIVVGAVSVLCLVWIVEYRRRHRTQTATKKLSAAALFTAGSMVLFLAGCTPKPEPIVTGKDLCTSCKMSIADARFAAEVLTKKGKVYKFDDVHCMAAFLQARAVELSAIHQTLVADYNEPQRFIEVGKAEFVIGSAIKSPMGGNAAAFVTAQAATATATQFEGSRRTNWPTLYNILVK